MSDTASPQTSNRPAENLVIERSPSIAPKKIIGVISFMNAGGAQEALLRLARQMRARGHDMEVWFLYEQNSIHASEPFTRTLIRKPKLSPLEYIRVFFDLWRAFKVARPDAAIGFLPLGAVFGLLAAKLARVPTRIASQRSPGTTFGRVMRTLDRLVGATSVYTRIICVSNAVRNSFNDYPVAYRDKLSVVHNGIEWTPSPMSQSEARASLGLPPKRFIFAAVGRTKPQKNYPILLDALARVPDALLVIAGDGSLRPKLEVQAASLGISSRVIFLGALSRDRCRDLLTAADAFVQSSLFEGQSNAVLEAMHQGLPIILSDIPEQRETIVDEATGEEGGILAPLGDVEAWAVAMERVKSDAATRTTLSRTGHSLVSRLFTLERMIDGFETVLTGVQRHGGAIEARDAK